MAQANIVQESIDRFQEAFESIDREVEKLQKNLRSRGKELEKELESRRKGLEKRWNEGRKEFEKRAQEGGELLRTELSKSETYRRADEIRKDVNKFLAKGLEEVLGAVGLASKSDLTKLNRRLNQLSKKVRELERSRKPERVA